MNPIDEFELEMLRISGDIEFAEVLRKMALRYPDQLLKLANDLRIAMLEAEPD